MLHNKILRAMCERVEVYGLQGKIPMDEAFLGGVRPGDKAARGSENKLSIDAANSLNEAGPAIEAKITLVSGFSSGACPGWGSKHLTAGCSVLPNGLACCRSVLGAGCSHGAMVISDKPSDELPEFGWINIQRGNLKQASASAFTPSTTATRAYGYEIEARRSLGGFGLRFYRHFAMARCLRGSPMRPAAVTPARSRP